MDTVINTLIGFVVVAGVIAAPVIVNIIKFNKIVDDGGDDEHAELDILDHEILRRRFLIRK